MLAYRLSVYRRNSLIGATLIYIYIYIYRNSLQPTYMVKAACQAGVAAEAGEREKTAHIKILLVRMEVCFIH